MRSKCLAALTAAALLPVSALANQVDVSLFGTIDETGGFDGVEIGDEIQVFFSYDSKAAEGATGNFPGSAFGLFIVLIDSVGNEFFPFVDQPDGDIFISPSEFDMYYGPEPLQLGDNFGFTLRNSSVPLDQDLMTATNILVPLGGDALSIFTEGDGFLQNDDTLDGELFFTIQQIEFVPEPASLVLLGGVGLAFMGRRRRTR